MTAYLNKSATTDTENKLVDEWLFEDVSIFSDEEKALVDEWLEDRKGFFPNPLESAVKQFVGVEDEATNVLLTSMSPLEKDLEKEFSTMPDDVQEIFREKIVNLMRNPNFARSTSLGNINFTRFLNPFEWKDIKSEVTSYLEPSDWEHLDTGDWRETTLGVLPEEFLYRGQKLSEMIGPGFFKGDEFSDQEVVDAAKKNRDKIYKGLIAYDIKPFTGDLPSYYMGVKDAGEYFDKVTFLPKSFTKFDMDRPVYDMSQHFNIKEGIHRYDGEGVILKLDASVLPDVLSDLQQLKTGQQMGINLGDDSSHLGGIRFEESIDLGGYTRSLGYDHEEGMFYFSATDIWDLTQGEEGISKYGNISPYVGNIGEGVQLYGRRYISEEDLLEKIIIYDRDNYRGTRAIDIVGNTVTQTD